MPSYIAWLRAVNVGGRVVKMATLRGYLVAAGCTDVETHIQSGNVRLTSPLRSRAKVEAALETALWETCGFEVKTLVRTPKELSELVKASPPSPLGEDARHYVAYLRDSPSAEAASQLNAWDVPGERATVAGRDVHLWLTKSSHEAKISNARIEKITGMASTLRDWKVVSALAAKWS